MKIKGNIGRSLLAITIVVSAALFLLSAGVQIEKAATRESQNAPELKEQWEKFQIVYLKEPLLIKPQAETFSGTEVTIAPHKTYAIGIKNWVVAKATGMVEVFPVNQAVYGKVLYIPLYNIKAIGGIQTDIAQ